MAKVKDQAQLDKLNAFQIVESYKNIRMNLLYALVGSENKTVVVTSSMKNEGKTTTAANLAMSISQNGAKVLLIDADLRKSRQHKLFKVPNQNGLSKLIIDQCTLQDAIVKNIKPGLDLIAAGPTPPNPSELLGSKRMRELLEELSKMYDYILLDTPPLNIVSDALALVDASAGFVIVARHKITQYDELQKSVDIISAVNGHILGVIINDVKRRFDSYTSNYYDYSDKED